MIDRTLSITSPGWLLIFAVMTFLSCNRTEEGFSAEELDLINGTASIMRVLTIDDADDSSVLRNKSSDLPAEALASDDFAQLSKLMVATVTHPSQDGVGIAAPQVGLNRRVIAVQRFDKKGEPFEVYANVHITWVSDSLTVGPEGCLSVPDMRGDVSRSTCIVVEYADLDNIRRSVSKSSHAGSCYELPVIRDTIRGFTAVIFQHETDHLEGILYIDRL